MKLYFAGSDGNPNYNKILHAANAHCRLESYYTLRPKSPSTDFRHLLLDSGGYVARTKGIDIKVEDYAKFINRYSIKLAFNLDTNDTPQTLRNQEYLNKHTAAYIIPIYHMSDWQAKDYLIHKFIADGFDYIGLGGVAGVGVDKAQHAKFMSHCFSITRDKTKVHGLGMTSTRLLHKYPFYSVDSTSWLSAARYGNSIDKTDKRVTMFRARTKHYLDNTQREVGHWVKTEADITRLWAARGVTWN